MGGECHKGRMKGLQPEVGWWCMVVVVVDKESGLGADKGGTAPRSRVCSDESDDGGLGTLLTMVPPGTSPRGGDSLWVNSADTLQ